MRQGDTTPIEIIFSDSIEDYDLLVAVYDDQDNEVYLTKLSDEDSHIQSIGGNGYKIVLPHTLTKHFVGKYYLELLVKSPGSTEFVNSGETPVKINFKPCKLAEGL